MSGKQNSPELVLAEFFALQLFAKYMAKKRVYSDSFKSFNGSAVAVVKNLGPCILKRRNSDEEKMYYSRELVQQLSSIYGMTPPNLYFGKDGTTPGTSNSFYSPTTHSITMMNKPSLVTLLHEFRHAMQYSGFDMIDQDKEEDARAWSMSLFKIALPKSHKRAVEKNLVHFK